MDLQSVDILKAPRWRVLRLGALLFMLVACGLLLASLISTGSARVSSFETLKSHPVKVSSLQ